MTLGRLPTASELGPLLGTHEEPGDPSPRADAQAEKSLINCRKGTEPLSLLVPTHTGSCFLPRPSCSPPGLVGVNPELGLLGQLGWHWLMTVNGETHSFSVAPPPPWEKEQVGQG